MLDIEPQLQSLSQRERSLLQSMGASIIVPVTSAGGQLAGLLALGEKASHRPYTGDDRRLLQTLGNQLAVSLDNARLYSEALRARRDLERWVDGMEDSVLIIAPDRTIRFANRSAREDLAADVGEPCWSVMGYDKSCAVCSLVEAWSGDAGSTTLSRRIGSREYEIIAAPLREPDSAMSLIIVLRDVTSRNRIEAELRLSQAQLRDLASHQETVREEERRGIARELHDELGQYLTALKMDIATLSRHAPTNAHEEAQEKLSGMKSMVEATILAVQRMSSRLRPGILDDLGLVPALEWLARDFQERSGLSCQLEVGEEFDCDERYSTALFRICQESLTNVARHSHATGVSIQLRREASSVVLTVTDNGRGIPKAQLDDPHSFGVIGMRERARALGGEAYFENAKGGGTVVRVVLPFPSEPPSKGAGS
jgi:signal transduction histidine kinase